MTTKGQYYVNNPASATVPETTYAERPVRRKFSPAYKRRIVQEAAACGRGEIGALLRREGLYSSQLTDWRRQEAQGELVAPNRVKRGRKAQAQANEVAELRRENARLAGKLTQAEHLIDAQKKLSLALEQMLCEPPETN